jgi:hypothetical protein
MAIADIAGLPLSITDGVWDFPLWVISTYRDKTDRSKFNL